MIIKVLLTLAIVFFYGANIAEGCENFYKGDIDKFKERERAHDVSMWFKLLLILDITAAFLVVIWRC